MTNPGGFVATLRHPSAFVPIAMSLLALSLVVSHIVLAGTAREADEGTVAHLWQLLMGLQIPIIMLFTVRWLPRTPRATLAVLGLQLLAGAAAAAPVLYFQW